MKKEYDIFDDEINGDFGYHRRYPFTAARPWWDSSFAAQHRDFNEAFRTVGKLIWDAYNKQVSEIKNKNG